MNLCPLFRAKRARVRLAWGALAVALLTPVAAAAQPGAVTPKTAPVGEWHPLFDGKSLAGWMQSGFEAEGAVKVQVPFRDGPGAVVIEKGTTLSGLTWRRGGALPRMNYELTLEAMRLEGSDFFCGLTFPVGPSACSLIVGGWGGFVVGLSSVDHGDASENETSQERRFTDGRWYRIRIRVTEPKIEAWLDQEQIVDLPTKGRHITLRPGEIQKSLPLGIATYMTSAAVRDLRIRRLP